MFTADKYRSVTWLKGGRVYPQLDCFGIVNEIRRDLGLPEWPDFAGVTKDGGGLDREARKLMLSLKRCEPCEGAGVACYSGSTVSHVGIVVMLDNQLQVAECNPGPGVTFLPLSRFFRRFNRVEFWQ
ncbi:TPA: nitrite transporter [Klebsiella pneumoniae]|uniref:nitrite transporter n=1 Tax=Klebsiella pneumoniae complex TaxID=3390273 RepID=UPI000E2C86B8|nr:nitrite transporter [Klebsiella pneumoniae]HBQ6836653.1 nitrite transporter [Klebsiella quasipneumoniae subsp. similipneumoniae]MCF2462311.1 nitrite transporter [Klebsiella pneumoniae]MDZ6178097.1 nitrite transporter [Klebsiella pneumoniae]UKG62279.1 nitrite transporter [Klebsiella pneumoniae]SXG94469.1 nitrite transporter [Klebsiella pneumoniae]